MVAYALAVKVLQGLNQSGLGGKVWVRVRGRAGAGAGVGVGTWAWADKGAMLGGGEGFAVQLHSIAPCKYSCVRIGGEGKGGRGSMGAGNGSGVTLGGRGADMRETHSEPHIHLPVPRTTANHITRLDGTLVAVRESVTQVRHPPSHAHPHRLGRQPAPTHNHPATLAASRMWSTRARQTPNHGQYRPATASTAQRVMASTSQLGIVTHVLYSTSGAGIAMEVCYTTHLHRPPTLAASSA